MRTKLDHPVPGLRFLSPILVLAAGLMAGFLAGRLKVESPLPEAASSELLSPVSKTSTDARPAPRTMDKKEDTPVPCTTAPAPRITLPEFRSELGKMWVHSDAEMKKVLAWIGQLDEQDLRAAVGIVVRDVGCEWQRNEYVFALFRRLAQRDVMSALGYAQTLTHMNFVMAMDGVGATWMEKDPASVVAWLKAQPEGKTRDELLRVAVAQLAETAPETAFDLIQALSPALMREYLDPIFSSWTKREPVTALSRMMALPDRRKMTQALPGIISGWAGRDLPAAEAWTKALPKGPEQRAAMHGIIMVLSHTDPARAAARLLEFSFARDQIAAAKVVLGEWSRTDLASACTWARGLPPGPLKKTALMEMYYPCADGAPLDQANYLFHLPEEWVGGLAVLVDRWARKDIVAAAGYISALPPGNRRTSAMSRLMGVWMDEDSSAAIAWVRNLPTPAERLDAIQSSISGFARKDPVMAAALIDQLPPSPARRNCMGVLLQNWVESDPVKALEWARTVPAGLDRNDTYQKLVNSPVIQQCPSQVLALFMSLPAGPTRNRGLESCLKAWASQDVDEARRWVMQIEDRTLKITALRALEEKRGQ